MGLLTLIVIGEGIIVMLKAVNTVAKASAWDGSAFGVVLSALAIIVCIQSCTHQEVGTRS